MSLLKAEFRKILIETKTYYPDYIVGLVTDMLLFFLVLQTDGAQNVKVFGYILWLLTSGVLSEASINISTEKQLGTLQNLLIKPYSILQIIISKSLAWFTVNAGKAALVVLILGCFLDLSDLCHVSLLYVIFVANIGIMGISLMLSSLTLVFTKAASFVTVIGYGLLFLTGSIIPVPKIFRYSNPLSYGVWFSSLIFSGNASAANVLYLAALSAIWLAAGIGLFQFVFSRSKQFKWTY